METQTIEQQKTLNDSILKQITALYGLSVKDLKERYLALLPEANAQANKSFLIRRIAYKLQENAYGGLAATAQEKLETLQPNQRPGPQILSRRAGSASGHRDHKNL